jgi:hypothetical protein
LRVAIWMDGDGSPSTFSLRLAIDRKSGELMLAPQLEESDPSE